MKIKALILSLLFLNLLSAKDIFVSPNGDDHNKGTQRSPFATIERSMEEVKKMAGEKAVTVNLMGGDYHLKETVVFDQSVSGTSKYPVTLQSLKGEEAVIKGSKQLDQLEWTVYKDGIYVAKVPADLSFDQLYVNDVRQIRSRFPNYDYEQPLRGGKGYQKVTGGTNKRYDEWFSYDPAIFTTKDWEHPETAIVHAFQSHNWGNMQYKVSHVDKAANKVYLAEGGWQLQRSSGIGGKGNRASWFYIENVFEELDVAGEWFLDEKENQLYFYPPSGVDLSSANIEVPVVKDLFRIEGTKENPVTYITIKGLELTQSTLTFMEEYEPLARGDWAIHRGGAIYMEGAENCTVEDCNFESLGGNGVFMSAYNRDNVVRACRFVHTGESAVCFVGSPEAVRFYQTWDDREILGKSWEEMREGMDLEAGPKTPDYPKNCVVENCIMHDFGDFGKQVAAVYISMSHKIRSSHNTVYNCPRAGICINDGTWGGHIVEYCDIWETVRETGEHGPFNSWGRERQWKAAAGAAGFIKEYTMLDAIDVTVIRNNRIANYRKSISAGNWTIDLDDGSSNYDIYNNLNLGSTIKLRDGAFRKVHNNITVSAVPLGWHVWPEDSEDEIYKNVFVISGAVPGAQEPTKQFIRPINLPKNTTWSKHYNNNLYWNVNYKNNPEIIKDEKMAQWVASGYDADSKIAAPLFVDPVNGDYSVKENSPALALGFENFSMTEFGHTMTRIIPMSGDFENQQKVTLEADERMDKKGTLRYTTDGSEPTMDSPIYTKALQVTTSTMVKARSYTEEGIALGFTAEANYVKVDKVIYPSWLTTLLDGKYTGPVKTNTKKALEEVVMGALLVNIGDDPDLIDASGGYNTGCLIRSINADKGSAWLAAGFDKNWIVQKANGKNVNNIAELKAAMTKHAGEQVELTCVRNYKTKVFTLDLSK